MESLFESIKNWFTENEAIESLKNITEPAVSTFDGGLSTLKEMTESTITNIGPTFDSGIWSVKNLSEGI